ncbi:unnamed protein product, partial [Chrysoparadoxa australica]
SARGRGQLWKGGVATENRKWPQITNNERTRVHSECGDRRSWLPDYQATRPGSKAKEPELPRPEPKQLIA